jgi:spore germination cell wall hydrolase CwlJ-like protein
MNETQIVKAPPELTLPSRRTLAIAGALLAMVLVALLAWWHGRPAPSAPQAAPGVTKLERLPARPEDIEAHGGAAQSILPTDQARKTNAAVPFASGPIAIAKPFVFTGTDEDRTRALQCLATAVVYEAGDDPVGQAAVAQVVLNRARHAAFPGTICGVVYQGAERRTGCQFTFTCDGSLQRQMSDSAWRHGRQVAENALAGSVDASVGLATHYHTDWVYPYWSPQLNKLARVGTHLFFGWPGSWGGPRAFGRKYPGREAMPGKAIGTGGTIADTAVPVPTDLGRPKILGLPMPKATLPAGMGSVPLYGNRLRLSRADGGAFGLLAAPGAGPEKLVNAALALCAKQTPCEVAAWANEDDIPGEYPIPAGARGTMIFEYVRGGTTRFDCSVFPNKDPKRCL